MRASPPHIDSMSFVGYEGSGGGTSSTLGSSFNVLCTVMGTGLLQLPYGGAQSGWCSVIVLSSLGLMACYTAVILIKCVDMMRNTEPLRTDLSCDYEASNANVPTTYGDIGAAAYGRKGRWAVTVQMHLTLSMVATIYNLLAGQNLQIILRAANIDLSLTTSILVVTLIVWFHVFLKTLGEVAVCSALNLAILILLEFAVIGVALTTPPSDKPQTTFLVEDFLSFGGAFASFAFAFGVHPILPTVYGDMRYPEMYRQMIYGSFLFIAALYVPMLSVGYAVYGDKVTSPIYKVPSMSGSPIVRAVIIAMTFPCLGGYAIVLNPVERALEGTLGIDRWKSPLLSRIVLRSCFIAGTAMVSIWLQEDFPPLLNLVSSFTSTNTEFIFPSLFYIKLCRMTGTRLSLLEWVWNALILVSAIVGAIFGTIGALRQIFHF